MRESFQIVDQVAINKVILLLVVDVTHAHYVLRFGCLESTLDIFTDLIRMLLLLLYTHELGGTEATVWSTDYPIYIRFALH